MALEYVARAVSVSDTKDGQKVLVFATACHRTVKIFVQPNQAELVVQEIETEPST